MAADVVGFQQLAGRTEAHSIMTTIRTVAGLIRGVFHPDKVSLNRRAEGRAKGGIW